MKHLGRKVVYVSARKLGRKYLNQQVLKLGSKLLAAKAAEIVTAHLPKLAPKYDK